MGSRSREPIFFYDADQLLDDALEYLPVTLKDRVETDGQGQE